MMTWQHYWAFTALSALILMDKIIFLCIIMIIKSNHCLCHYKTKFVNFLCSFYVFFRPQFHRHFNSDFKPASWIIYLHKRLFLVYDCFYVLVLATQAEYVHFIIFLFAISFCYINYYYYYFFFWIFFCTNFSDECRSYSH